MKRETRELILSLFAGTNIVPKRVILEKVAALPDGKMGLNPPRTKKIEGYGVGSVEVGESVVVFGESIDPDQEIRQFETSLVTEVLDTDFVAGASGAGTEVIKFRTQNSVYVMSVDEES